MKQQFIKVCMLSGLAMPLFSASLLAAGNPNPIVAQQQQVLCLVSSLLVIVVLLAMKAGA